MAGHGYTKLDPAVERWNVMREDVYKHFRFNSRTARQSILGMIVFPAAIFALSYNQFGVWDWTGKRKGESLARIAPAPEAEATD
ncbi:hypothetical protein BD309DRAFT_887440 [Dichomitus squalens]|uniref:Uncharacterized protein n=1 Tax=Dichomitus squalens TaxID=114155 RepID=A0A4Q9Q1J6_9APHY|nr:hypothetical protein BD309DRAFT_887440 [Dichomitus squalens]TBU60716.1 hypothetical protein BD310DRAFT_922538 [Dichomitus squalens]